MTRLVRRGVSRSCSQTRYEDWRRQVALLANRVHIGAIEKSAIRSPVREMASGAAFGLDDSMFIDEGSGRIGVAFGTHRDLPRRGFPCIFFRNTVRIVAVCALHQTFVYLVVKGKRELRLHVVVALKA